MKLRNKKTGEIIDIYKGEITLHYNQGRKTIHFKRIEDLDEWENYEEPKEYWTINCIGEVDNIVRLDESCEKYIQELKDFGNYFETKEEAEKAVEKLKAVKRLKDKGFVFCGTDCINKNNVIYFEFGESPLTQSEADEAEKDLNLLFGGEE